MEKWENIILERIDKLINNQKYFFLSYQTELEVDYDDIEKIWNDFVQRKYSNNLTNKVIDLKKTTDLISLKIALGDEKLSTILDEIFSYHIKCFTEDAIFFYFKKSNKILVKLKSFSPLMYKNTISLPFWSIKLKDKKIINDMESILKNQDNLAIFCYC